MTEEAIGVSSVGRSTDTIPLEDTGNDDQPQSRLALFNNTREDITRRLKYIGKHFNILDKLFKKNNNIARLQFGANADGVFSNLSAKPDQNSEQRERDKPPTYEEASADMAPSYYGMDDDGAGMYYNEICFDGLPVGNIVNLLWNMIVSVSFQFVGFLLTYILHTSHAAKQGSRFGLGLTFLGYAYSMVPNDVTSKIGKTKKLDRLEPDDPNEYDDMHLYSGSTQQDEFESDLSHGVDEQKARTPFLVVVLIVLGFFIMTKSLYDYISVKKKEKRYLAQEQV